MFNLTTVWPPEAVAGSEPEHCIIEWHCDWSGAWALSSRNRVQKCDYGKTMGSWQHRAHEARSTLGTGQWPLGCCPDWHVAIVANLEVGSATEH